MTKSKRILSIDFETFSDIDISKAGLYRYMESPVFEILLIGFAFDDDDPTVLDLTAMTPEEIERWKQQFMEWMSDPDIILHAYNAEFEINVFSTWFGYQIPLDNWWDTMVTALTCGLPRSLKDVGNALGMPEEKAKLTEGKRLVTYFCTPCKPTLANGMRTRNTRKTDPEKWAKFVEYNRQDVVAERAIWYKVRKYEPDETEHQAWMMSTEINRRGVMVDRQMAAMAVRITEEYNGIQVERLKQITGLENPNSNSQLAKWLNVSSVAKANVEEELKTAEGERQEVLLLRQEIGKTSVAKYEAMLSSVCDDDRIRGLFVFYGANRSGRFSSRLVQLQNLPQNHLDDLDSARAMVKADDWESIDCLYGNVPDTLSQLIRTAFIAKPGHTFAVADFSAIEARVIAYMADEQWRMDLFAEGGDIYCKSASKMFGVPVEKHGVNKELRQKGKVAELACGYGGSVGAMSKMGAAKLGLSESEIGEIVRAWREASPNIVKYWWQMGNAMLDAVKYGVVTKLPHDMAAWRTNKMLIMQLPSGRCLRYYDPKIGVNKFGEDSVTYQGYENGKWLRLESYGPKFVENCLAEGTLVTTNRGCIAIEDVKLDDLIFDGCDFVQHDGVVCKGEQPVVKVGTLLMTPEHLILTSSGWIPCGQADGLDWMNVRFAGNDTHKITVTDYGSKKRVYDIRNCGPRHQFCVCDDGQLRIVHNCIQGIARDCLVESMKRVSKRYPNIVMHVHDEMIVEVPEEEAEEALKFICDCMAEPMPWAPGLLLRGDGYITKYYKKD